MNTNSSPFGNREYPGKGLVDSLTRWLLDDRFLLIFQCLSLLLIIAGSRFLFIGNYGSDLPFWDQWDAEGEGLYKRAYDGVLTFQNWFAPHNEHRIFFTRLVSYILLVLNGQWDARLQMLVNSSFYALVGSALFMLFAKERGYLFGMFWLTVLAAVFSCPFGWENTIAGFQSQFYLLTAFSLAAIWLLINKSAWSFAWMMGVFFGFCALFSMASGILAPVAVLAFMGIALARERQNWRGVLRCSWPTIGFCLLIIVAGAFLMTTVEAHAVYKAEGIVAFCNALFYCLAWPWPQQLWWAIVSWLPSMLLIGSYLLRRLMDGKVERFLITITLFLVLQAAATAYSRSTIVWASRYCDMFSLDIIFNILCACVLLRNRLRSIQGVLWLSLLVVYLAVNGLGMYELGFKIDVYKRKILYDIEKYRTSGFVASGDSLFFAGMRRKEELPYPEQDKLARLLRDPALEPILPVSVRKSLAVKLVSVSPVYLSSDVYTVGDISPYPWEKLWSIPSSGQHFGSESYAVTKTKGLPFLHFFVSGDAGQLTVVDSQNVKHSTFVVHGPDGWQEAYAYCPGVECRFDAGTTDKRVVFSEPKEMGTFSLAALLLTRCAHYIKYAGFLLFFSLSILSVLKFLKERKNALAVVSQ